MPPIYLAILEDATFGYADVTCLTMLTHLLEQYGTITPKELKLNRNSFDYAWLES